MKIEKLGSNKIKVTVTPSELNVWDINPQSITPDSPQLREFIASLLAQSAEETGFDLASASILVEARPQGNDFVFVITRMAYEDTQRELTRAIIRKKLLNGQYKAKSSAAPALSFYRFRSLPEFAAFWRAEGARDLQEAALYRADGGYYLGIKRAQKDYARVCALVSEYAAPVDAAGFDAYLGEHGGLIVKQDIFDDLSRCYE